MRGIVTKILPSRGFAFVRGDDGYTSFAHAQEFQPIEFFEQVREGNSVEYEVTEDGIDPATGNKKGNGLRARRIRRCT